MRVFIVLLISALLGACASSSSVSGTDPQATQKGKIRFYRVNDHGQQTILTVVRNTDKAGCHNLFKKSRLHRVAVTGFQYCEVYSSKNCEAGSELNAQWMAKKVKAEDKKHPTARLTKGTRWVFDPGGNVRAHSWRCVE